MGGKAIVVPSRTPLYLHPWVRFRGCLRSRYAMNNSLSFVEHRSPIPVKVGLCRVFVKIKGKLESKKRQDVRNNNWDYGMFVDIAVSGDWRASADDDDGGGEVDIRKFCQATKKGLERILAIQATTIRTSHRGTVYLDTYSLVWGAVRWGFP